MVYTHYDFYKLINDVAFLTATTEPVQWRVITLSLGDQLPRLINAIHIYQCHIWLYDWSYLISLFL